MPSLIHHMEKIFPKDITIDLLNEKYRGNMITHLDIEYTEIGDDFLSGKMPVDHRTMQPMNILHGGASVVLAETLGSVASSLCIDLNKKISVGLEINANHIKSVHDGYVYGKAQIVHLGKSTHIWQIDLTNSKGDLVCVSRLTVAVLDRK